MIHIYFDTIVDPMKRIGKGAREANIFGYARYFSLRTVVRGYVHLTAWVLDNSRDELAHAELAFRMIH
jgi:hypothetical protein